MAVPSWSASTGREPAWPWPGRRRGRSGPCRGARRSSAAGTGSTGWRRPPSAAPARPSSPPVNPGRCGRWRTAPGRTAATGAAGTAAGRPCRPSSSPRRRTGRCRGPPPARRCRRRSPRAGTATPAADPVAVAAQVDGDDAEVPGERGEDLSPVQFGREGDPVDEHERFGAAGAGALPHPRDPAARQLHQARTRSRGLPGHLPHGVTLLRCQSAGASDGTRPTIHPAPGPCVPDARSATGTKGPDTLWFYPCWW